MIKEPRTLCCKNQEPRRTRRIVFTLSSCFLFLMLCGLAKAQSLNTAELSVDTNFLRLGQQTVLKFSVTCSKDRKPIIPDWKDVLQGKLDIISASNADTISITNSQLKIRQELVVTKFNEDTIILDSLFIPLVKKRDTMFVSPNRLLIYPVLEDVDMDNEFRDIKAPVDVPYSWREILPYLLIIIGVIILGILTWVIFKIVRRVRQKKVVYVEPEPPKVIIPADIIALEKLNQLKADEKWFTTDSKRYITELTDILREYIFNRWGFDAQESTSEEILAADFILKIDHVHLEKLKEILRTADFVKFAKANTSTDENKLMLERAFTFVETTKDSSANKEENE